MTFIIRRRSPYVFALFPIKLGNDQDEPVVKTYINKDPKSESGLERIKKMFASDEYGDFSPELRYCLHLSTAGFVVGGLYGGIIRGRSAFVNFIDTNEATMFRNHLDAKRQLQDTVSLSVAKGAGQWGWRTGFFTSVYALISTLISVYRGKSGIVEHVDAGFVAGAMYNMKNGIRGAIVGGGLGSILGAIFGSFFYVSLVLSGQTIEEVRFWTYEWNKHREQLIQEGERKKRLKKDTEEIMQLTEDLTSQETAKLTKTN